MLSSNILTQEHTLKDLIERNITLTQRKIFQVLSIQPNFCKLFLGLLQNKKLDKIKGYKTFIMKLKMNFTMTLMFNLEIFRTLKTFMKNRAKIRPTKSKFFFHCLVKIWNLKFKKVKRCNSLLVSIANVVKNIQINCYTKIILLMNSSPSNILERNARKRPFLSSKTKKKFNLIFRKTLDGTKYTTR